MKKFSIKDFIVYNGPCIICGSKINLLINSVIVDYSSKYPIEISDPVSGFCINHGIIEAVLKVKYSYSLNLKIDISNNKFYVSDINKFATYLINHEVKLISKCNTCLSIISSNAIDFHNKTFVEPITLDYEKFYISHNHNKYIIISVFNENRTYLTVGDKEMSLPLIPLYKFKNKEVLLNKIKTCIVFS